MITNAEHEREILENTKRLHWLAVEEKRKTREAYAIKEISGWMYFGPVLGFIVAIIVGVIIWLSQDNSSNLWWIVCTGLAPIMLYGFASIVEENWKDSIIAKEEIAAKHDQDNFNNFDNSYSTFGFEERTLNGFKYKYDYIYTDSALFYWFYAVTKFILGLFTVLSALLIGILLFLWLGSISIAPTTIIIILLIIVIQNQNKEK